MLKHLLQLARLNYKTVPRKCLCFPERVRARTYPSNGHHSHPRNVGQIFRWLHINNVNSSVNFVTWGWLPSGSAESAPFSPQNHRWEYQPSTGLVDLPQEMVAASPSWIIDQPLTGMLIQAIRVQSNQEAIAGRVWLTTLIGCYDSLLSAVCIV